MAEALAQLIARLADHQACDDLVYLLHWDQRTTMPPAGFKHRGAHLAFLERTGHAALTDPEVGRLIEELEPRLDSLEPDSWEAAIIRTARRDYLKAVQVPTELRAEMVRAASEAAPTWIEAAARPNSAAFPPVL